MIAKNINVSKLYRLRADLEQRRAQLRGLTGHAEGIRLDLQALRASLISDRAASHPAIGPFTKLSELPALLTEAERREFGITDASVRHGAALEDALADVRQRIAREQADVEPLARLVARCDDHARSLGVV